MFNQFNFNDENIYKLIDLANIAIYWKDITGKYLGCNQYVLNILNLKSREEVIGKTDYDLWIKDEADLLVEIDRLVVQGNPYYGEESTTIANGEFKVYLTTKAPMLDNNGEIIGLVGTSTDITHFKTKMEIEKHKAVLNEEIKLKQIIDLVDASIYWKDKDGRILGCNQHVIDMFGAKSRKDVVGKTDYSYLSKNDADKIKTIDKLVLKKGSYRGEESGTLATGEKRAYFTTKNRLTDSQGKIVGIVGVSLDITAQKEADRLKLENMELEKQQLIDLVDANIYWKDTNGNTLGCNKYVLDMFGFSNQEEIIGRNDYEYLSKDEADKIKSVDQLVLKTGSYRGEEYTTVNGKQITYFSAKNRLLDSHGNVIGIVGASLDITAKKEAERLNLENEAKTKLLEQETQFRQFVAQMAHDIQSPVMSLNVIINESSKSIPEEERITLKTASMRISDIAQHMLSLYKNESDENETAQAVLVSASLLGVLGEKGYEHKEVKFTTDFKPQANFSFIRTQPSQFTRMISNLMNNAVEALENKADGKVGLRLNADQEWVKITINDNGKGMSAELVNKIKNNIAVSEGKKDGSGLGLAQVRETVKQNLGEFDIHSTQGQGTNIVLRFPLISPPQWVAKEIKVINGDTIIILDDDPSIHGALDTKLEPILAKMSDIKVIHFEEGKKAVNFINSLSTRQKNKVCLLTDYELLNQDINGLEVIEQTKIKRSTLITSHYTNDEIRQKAIDLRVKILPKKLADVVLIALDKKIRPGNKKVDMVWVDDAYWFIDDWIRRCFSHLKVDKYFDPRDFLEDVKQYPLDTKIILDRYYYDKQGVGAKCLGDGLEIAQTLHKKGYTNLFLLTGEELELAAIPDYLTVILKDEHKKIKNLAKL